MDTSPDSLPWHSLTQREQQAVDRAARGHCHKVIALHLGVSAGMVARHLASAARKVGVCSRVALVASYRRYEQKRPAEERGGERSGDVPVPPASQASLANLTRSELEVLDHLFAGLSNAGIAALRGRSVRTVANQVASIYRKLGVSSRLQLVAQLAPPAAG